jgi:hypothetical protein
MGVATVAELMGSAKAKRRWHSRECHRLFVSLPQYNGIHSPKNQ